MHNPFSYLYDSLLRISMDRIILHYARRSLIPGQLWHIETVGMIRVIHVSEKNVTYRCLEIETHPNEPEDPIFSFSKNEFFLRAKRLDQDFKDQEGSNVLIFTPKDKE